MQEGTQRREIYQLNRGSGVKVKLHFVHQPDPKSSYPLVFDKSANF